MKRLAIAIAAMISISSPSYAQSPTAEAIAKLGDSSFAQFQCSVLTGFAKGPNAAAHFNAGFSDLREFLTLARATGDEKFIRKVGGETPMIITMALGGPSIDFEIGRVYSAILQYVDDELRDRETWTHQKKDPSAPPVDPEIVQMRAEQKYGEQNCHLLVR